jgi:hypothetical protein
MQPTRKQILALSALRILQNHRRDGDPEQRQRTQVLITRTFEIAATRPDGTTEHWRRLGGTSMDHLAEAQDKAGLGGVVRVRPLTELEAA